MTAFETGTPSVRQIQKLIKDKTNVEVKIITNDILTGQIRWQDSECLCLATYDDKQITIWRTAIVYIQPK
jgi:host factor-I protein